ncbi:hypothetical protein FRC03_005650 [Tulasnella sp. 419]|nr:hypothetical protein FRC03_005650 [Tulasnella sp. 419]
MTIVHYVLPQSFSVASILVSGIKLGCIATCSWLSIFLFKVFVWWPYKSHLKYLPGPEKNGRLFGTHLPGIMDPDLSPRIHEEYREKYGLNIRVHGLGCFDERYVTFDPVAINYMLGRASDLYPKPWQSRRFISRLIGEGLFVSEGEEHRRQRKIISPAFSSQALRALQPIFFRKASELRDALLRNVKDAKEEGVCQDMHNWLWRVTLDVIGLTGFSYSFNAVRDETNEVYRAYRDIFQIGVTVGFTLRSMIEIWIPWLQHVFPNKRVKQLEKSRDTIEVVAMDIVTQKQEMSSLDSDDGKDILSLLIKANRDEKSAAARLNNQELITQINTLLFVGSDTTSLSLDWTLNFLSKHPDVQSRLREEIIECLNKEGQELGSGSFDEVTQAEILSLPYLDCVVKESLRLMPPVHSTLRVATQDDWIPTSDGKPVFIREGQFCHIAIEGFNTRKDYWGPDGLEFKPERWLNLPTKVRDVPGIVGGLMSFSLGPHACPGYRFALLEMKSVLAAVLPALEFEPMPDTKIGAWNVLLTKPFVRGQRSRGVRLPLMVKPHIRP